MITADAARKDQGRERDAFRKPRMTENWYAARLREIARHVGQIIRGFPPGDPDAIGPINVALTRYAEALDPWARATAARMLMDVARRDRKAWDKLARLVGKTLANEIATTPIGHQMRGLMAEQVGLIKSLPIEAAQRVHKLTIEGIARQHPGPRSGGNDPGQFARRTIPRDADRPDRSGPHGLDADPGARAICWFIFVCMAHEQGWQCPRVTQKDGMPSRSVG